MKKKLFNAMIFSIFTAFVYSFIFLLYQVVFSHNGGGKVRII